MELKTTLNEEMANRYKTVKNHTGMHDDKNVLGFLISKEYDRIERAKYHRLFLSHATYDMAEKAAEARRQTIDEYIAQIIDEIVKNAKEAEKHGN